VPGAYLCAGKRLAGRGHYGETVLKAKSPLKRKSPLKGESPSTKSSKSTKMPESQLLILFLAIVQMESAGDLSARNGSAVGPAQIQPAVVKDIQSWGHQASLKDRSSLDGSFRLFVLYTDRWVARHKLPDTPQTRANIWRHGPNSKYALKGQSSKYALKVQSMVNDPSLGWAHPNSRKWLADRGKRDLRR
jgi:hypothetical protein